MRFGLGLDLVGEGLDVPTLPPSGSATLVTPVSSIMHLLRAQRHLLRRARSATRELSSSGVGVQRVGSTEHSRTSASIAVRTTLLSWLLRREARLPGGLGVEAQPLRLSRSWSRRSVAHPARPDPAGGAELGDLLEEVDVGIEEERQSARARTCRRRDRAT
jgi:hypothetical protein